MIRILSELWQYKALVWALVGRHLNSRYRGSLLGFLWSFLNPLCLIAVYSLVFKYYIRFDHVENYTLFLFTGLLPWIWFSSALLESTNSVSGGGSLITKAMFPPHVLPTVSVLTNLANFLFAIPLMLLFMLVTGVPFGVGILALPIVIFIELLFILGLSFLFASLNVYYRDVQHLLGNFMTLWFFLCPILYPSSVVPEKLRFTLMLNPVSLFTEMYQGMFLEGALPGVLPLAVGFLISLATLWVGCLVFNHYREGIAELV